MNADALSVATQALGFALVVAAGAVALGALAARSLFAMCVGLAAASALAACAMLALGRGAGGLALALAGVGVAPVLLMSGLLLSARGSRARSLPLVSLLIAGASVVAIAWVAPDLRAALASVLPEAPPPTLWLAALLFVAVCAGVALLGYGERGVIGHKDGEGSS